MIILSHFYGQLLCCELHESQTRRQLRVRIPKYPKVCCQPSPAPPPLPASLPLAVSASLSLVCAQPAMLLNIWLPFGHLAAFYINGSSLNCWPRFRRSGGGWAGAAFLAQNSNLVSKLSPRLNCCPRNELQLNSFSHFLLPLLSLLQLLALILTLIPRGTSHVPTVSRNYVNCKLWKLC